MIVTNANRNKKICAIKGCKLAKFENEDVISRHIILAQKSEKTAYFDTFIIKCSEKQAFFIHYSQNNQEFAYRRKPLYIINFNKSLEKSREIKIAYIKTLICLSFGYNGYSNKIIETLYLFLFQEALYA